MKERDFKTRRLAAELESYTATKHQREVGTGYFDRVREIITRGGASASAMAGSTERAQFGADPEQSRFGQRAAG